MEPFGILNFLKSILSVNDFTPNEPSSNMENQENFPNTTQEKSAQEKSTHDTQSQTKNVPLEMCVKGWLQEEEAKLGDTVTIKTVVGRLETGELMEEKPCYALNYGEFVPEILEIDQQLRGVLFEGAEA